MEIIVKKWEHHNRALGKYISSKKQYYEELKKGGFVSYEEGQRLAESKERIKKWTPSKDLIDKINYLKLKADSKGNIRHPEDLRNFYTGMKTELPDWLPKHYKE